MIPLNLAQSEGMMSLSIIEHNEITWINIENPTDADIDYIRKQYPTHHPLALEDCLSRIERPKIDDFNDHIFIVTHDPKVERLKENYLRLT